MNIPVFDFTHYQLTSYAIPPLIAGVAVALLGIIVLIREQSTRVSLVFLALTTCASLWLLASALMYSTSDRTIAFEWAKIQHCGVVLIPAAVFVFTLAVTRLFSQFRLLMWSSITISILFLFGIFLTDWFLAGVRLYFWGYYVQYGMLSILFLAYFFSVALASLYLYFLEYQRSPRKSHKERFKSFLFAFGIGYLGSLDFLAAYGIAIYPFGYLFVFIFIILIGRMVWRYHLVDITPSFAANRIIETMINLLFVYDAEGFICLVNEATRKTLGYSEKELIGKSIECLVNPNSKELHQLREGMKSLILRDKEMVFHAKNGTPIDVSISLSHLQNRNRETVGTVMVARDIRERKQAAAALQDSESKWRQLVETAPDYILMINREGTILFLNRAVMGTQIEDFVGKNAYDFIPAEQQNILRKAIDRVFTTGEMNSFEIQGPGPGRTVAWYSTRIGPIKRSGQITGATLIATDITLRKQAEDALLQKTVELARANAEREQLELFAYVASHDLQEPLQKIIGFGDLLKRQASKILHEEARDYLDRMQKAAMRMSQLIEDLLNFARVTVKVETSELKSINLQEIIYNVLSDLEIRIAESKGEIELENLPMLTADALQMHQLFQNLIGNALKFHKKGAIPKVKIYSRPLPNGFVEITVEDNGIGFDPQYAEKIFRPFERLHSRTEYEGSGVGLAICRKIVINHGGTLKAKSIQGNGSLFVLTLPATQH